MHNRALTLLLTKNLLLTHCIVQPYYYLTCCVGISITNSRYWANCFLFWLPVWWCVFEWKTHHTHFSSTSSILPPPFPLATIIIVPIPIFFLLVVDPPIITVITRHIFKWIIAGHCSFTTISCEIINFIKKINTIVIVVFNQFTTTNLIALKVSSLLSILNWPIQQ